ncbi:HD domain-containing phosphohydrolase [Gallionella capsiferriformans]|uniref:Response regulator receiver modulated metal dependent phosphohydrolase n=1 Tax=Gallionella capsiferriformans (strain ES-2) TaxID=395494 RepID=D9SIT2_GALCS|nr:response regulator receiver modulated metal dependent phosphohydrolase [Gallionella capsiferriformans ES-2]
MLTRKTLLLVDDEPSNLHVLKQILSNDYQLIFAKDGEKALQLAREKIPDLILLDVMMPELSGYEVCAALKSDRKTSKIPVIFISALNDVLDETHGFEVGAVDYITKPVNPAIVRARVATHLSLVRTEELEYTQLEIIHRLGRAAEYRDNETGLHVIRMSHYSRLLALAAGFSELAADRLFQAAPMHDVGKIGIPDRILLKPGSLDEEEWKVMRTHPEVGAQIIGEHDSALLKEAKVISLTHHEKWDGSGYPNQLRGEEIPLVGRIVAIVDVFDALTTERPYKKAWSVEDALALINRESGKHFDPALVGLFMKILPAVLEVKHRWAEEMSPP